MAVLKVIELLASSEKSWEDAAQNAVKMASKTINGIRSVYVQDMSGVVKGDKIIEFQSYGTISSNGSICDLSIESSSASSGTYSLSDSTINSSKCSNNTLLKIRFHKNGSILTINYPCDEACIAKYIKE